MIEKVSIYIKMVLDDNQGILLNQNDTIGLIILNLDKIDSEVEKSITKINKSVIIKLIV